MITTSAPAGDPGDAAALSMPERGKAAAARAASGKARAQDAFWIRVARLVEGEDSTAAGVTVGMLGAQRERVRIPAEVAGLSPTPNWPRLSPTWPATENAGC